MTKSSDLLSQLKDIHQPQPVSWWPPAPGWFILIILILITCFLLGMFAYKAWRRHYRKRFALTSLKNLKVQYQKQAETATIAQVSILLKRVMIARFGKSKIATLTDIEWLAFLDDVSKTDEYTQGTGQALLTMPYQATAQPVPELFVLIEKTMKRCL